MVNQDPRKIGDKGLTVVNAGSKLTIPDEARLAEWRAASAALAREAEEAAARWFEPKGPAPEVKCGGCGSKTHRLVSCLMAAPNGLMKGCPMCNTTKHDVDACPKLRDIKTRFRHLVVIRGNMPPFASKQMSFHWASVYRQFRADEELKRRRHRNVPRLPWTPEFTQQLVEAQIQHYQEGLDKRSIKHAHLPIDPATMDWATAQRTYPAAEAPSSQIQDKAAQATKSGKSGDHADNLPTESEFVEDDDIDWWR